ncbi:DNA repair protein RadC [Sphingomonas paucimobilis]|nr:DNA repair protein RadC [Sphingomonas paucimobilis]
MDVTEQVQIVALDEDWRPLGRVDGRGDWPGIVRALLSLESAWLVIEQQRPDEPVPRPRLEDIRLSRAVASRLRPMEMKLADHVIRGGQRRFSFRQAGLL